MILDVDFKRLDDIGLEVTEVLDNSFKLNDTELAIKDFEDGVLEEL